MSNLPCLRGKHVRYSGGRIPARNGGVRPPIRCGRPPCRGESKPLSPAPPVCLVFEHGDLGPLRRPGAPACRYSWGNWHGVTAQDILMQGTRSAFECRPSSAVRIPPGLRTRPPRTARTPGGRRARRFRSEERRGGKEGRSAWCPHVFKQKTAYEIFT